MKRIFALFVVGILCLPMTQTRAQAWPWSDPCKTVKSNIQLQDKIRLELYKQAKAAALSLLKNYNDSHFSNFKQTTTTSLNSDIKIYSIVVSNPKCFKASDIASSENIISQNQSAIKGLQTYTGVDGFPKDAVRKVSIYKAESIFDYFYKIKFCCIFWALNQHYAWYWKKLVLIMSHITSAWVILIFDDSISCFTPSYRISATWFATSA